MNNLTCMHYHKNTLQTFFILFWEISLHKTDVTHYHLQLKLLDKIIQLKCWLSAEFIPTWVRGCFIMINNFTCLLTKAFIKLIIFMLRFKNIRRHFGLSKFYNIMFKKNILYLFSRFLGTAGDFTHTWSYF